MQLPAVQPPAKLPEGYVLHSVNPCTACRHSTKDAGGGWHYLHMACTHPDAPRHVVSGSSLLCETLRTNPALCGMDGAWFELRPQKSEVPRVETQKTRVSRWARFSRRVMHAVARPLALVLLGVALYAGIAWVSGAIREKRDEIRERGGSSPEQHPEKLSRETPKLVPESFLAEVVRPLGESAHAIRRDDQRLNHRHDATIYPIVRDQTGSKELLQEPSIHIYGFSQASDLAATHCAKQFHVALERRRAFGACRFHPFFDHPSARRHSSREA